MHNEIERALKKPEFKQWWVNSEKSGIRENGISNFRFAISVKEKGGKVGY